MHRLEFLARHIRVSRQLGMPHQQIDDDVVIRWYFREDRGHRPQGFANACVIDVCREHVDPLAFVVVLGSDVATPVEQQAGGSSSRFRIR